MSTQESSTTVNEATVSDPEESWMWSWLRWRPTSFQLLETAEKKMLEGNLYLFF